MVALLALNREMGSDVYIFVHARRVRNGVLLSDDKAIG